MDHALNSQQEGPWFEMGSGLFYVDVTRSPHVWLFL